MPRNPWSTYNWFSSLKPEDQTAHVQRWFQNQLSLMPRGAREAWSGIDPWWAWTRYGPLSGSQDLPSSSWFPPPAPPLESSLPPDLFGSIRGSRSPQSPEYPEFLRGLFSVPGGSSSSQFISGAKRGLTKGQAQNLMDAALWDTVRSQQLADQHYHRVNRLVGEFEDQLRTETRDYREGLAQTLKEASGAFYGSLERPRAMIAESIQASRDNLMRAVGQRNAQVQGAVSSLYDQVQMAMSGLDASGQPMDQQARADAMRQISYQASLLSSQVAAQADAQVLQAGEALSRTLASGAALSSDISRAIGEFSQGIAQIRSVGMLESMRLWSAGQMTATQMLAANAPTHVSLLNGLLAIYGTAMGGAAPPAPKSPSPVLGIVGSLLGGLFGKLF